MLNALFGNPPTGEVLEQAVNFIQVYYQACGVVDFNLDPDKEMLRHVLLSARHSIRQLDHPSIFKKVAIFTHSFVYTCPLSCNFPEKAYPKEITQRFYHNAVIAFEISRASLHGAKVGEKTLENPIEISRHQHKDLMIAFCEIREMREAYTRLIAIIYETLAYEFNKGIRYLPNEPLPK